VSPEGENSAVQRKKRVYGPWCHDAERIREKKKKKKKKRKFLFVNLKGGRRKAT